MHLSFLFNFIIFLNVYIIFIVLTTTKSKVSTDLTQSTQTFK